MPLVERTIQVWKCPHCGRENDPDSGGAGHPYRACVRCGAETCGGTEDPDRLHRSVELRDENGLSHLYFLCHADFQRVRAAVGLRNR